MYLLIRKKLKIFLQKKRPRALVYFLFLLPFGLPLFFVFEEGRPGLAFFDAGLPAFFLLGTPGGRPGPFPLPAGRPRRFFFFPVPGGRPTFLGPDVIIPLRERKILLIFVSIFRNDETSSEIPSTSALFVFGLAILIFLNFNCNRQKYKD